MNNQNVFIEKINVMKFFESIKALWKKIVDWVKGATSKVDDFLVKYAPIAVNIVNWIKEFNESSAADLVETILQKVDKKYGAKYVAVVRKWMEDNLPRIIDALGIVSEVASCEKVSDKIIAAQKAINLLPENLNATMWSSLSALLANSLADDGKLSISEALAIVGYVYENNLNKD